MAAEMSNFTKENIKSQAAQTMVAQANARAQQVLSLLQ
jgi:flagellin